MTHHRTALVVNCSAPHYNLGAAKLTAWLRSQGVEVTPGERDPGMFAVGYDLVALSVIFSWHAPIAREIALRVEGHSDVWCGGPAMFAMRKWWHRETGLGSVAGIDWRFERHRGGYDAVFASRGCPVNCWFCVVPRIEGTAFTLDWDFEPAPALYDNNLSALPADFQQHVVDRYSAAGIRVRDANSGFEPRTFTAETYRRWKPVLAGPWRFAFDELAEERYVRDMMRILAPESSKRKQVYVLIGNEPIDACEERVRKVIEWGGEPYCQPLIALNHLRGPIRARHDWTPRRLRDYARYVNRHLWRYIPFDQYDRQKADRARRQHRPARAVT